MNQRKRVAIVTGAARGIGFAVAERFAKDGYSVALLDINEALAKESAEKLRQTGASAIGIACDVAKVADLEAAVATTVKAFGAIDVVVNNAGILYSKAVEDVTENEWDRELSINLKGMFFLVQKALPYLKEGISPRVVNVASMAGRTGGFEAGVPYSASKGGAIALTRGLARRLAQYKITVNAVCPSATQSEMIMDWTEEQLEGLRRGIPIGHVGQPEEIAAAVCFLASEEASYITGSAMDVNGGAFMG